MARNNHITNSFIAGEASPKFFGRSETQQYNQCLEDTLNVIVHPQGGCGRRPGTYFMHKFLDSTNGSLSGRKARLFSFHASDGTRWQILIVRPTVGEVVKTLWQAVQVNGPVVVGNAEFVQADWTNAALTWLTAHYSNTSFVLAGLSELQYSQTGDVAIFQHPNILPFQIIYDGNRPAGEKFMLRSYPDFHDALVGRPIYNPISAGYVSVTNSDAWRAMPFLTPVVKSNSSFYGLKLTNTAGVFTVTAVSGAPPFTINSDWVGRVFKFTTKLAGVSTTGVYLVRSVTGTTANVTKIGGTDPLGAGTNDNFGYDDVDAFYEEGAWDTDKGYPRTSCFFDQRIIFGGSETFPDTLWCSTIANIYKHDYRGLTNETGYPFTQTTSSAFSRTLSGEDRLCEIRWLKGGKTVAVGTNFREFIVKGPSADKTLGIDNSACDPETAFGSSHTQAVHIANATLFLNKSRKEVRELVWSQDEESYKAQNLNIIAEHIARKSGRLGQFGSSDSVLKELVLQADTGIIWAIDTNGALLGMTRDRDQDVAAWHYHNLGGSGLESTTYNPGGDGLAEGYYGNEDAYTEIQSISSLQRKADAEDAFQVAVEPDDVFLLVNRNRNIGDKADGAVTTTDYVGQDLYLELIAHDFERNLLSDYDISLDPQEAPVYLDCAYLVEVQGNASGIIAAVSHPFGKGDTLALVRDGVYEGEVTVEDDKTIDLSSYLDGQAGTTHQMILGFDYESYFVPVTPEVPATIGSSQGQQRRTHQMVVHCYRSVGFSFGRATDVYQENTPVDELEEVEFSDIQGNEAGVAPILFTGNKRVSCPPGYEERPKIKIQFHLPLPGHVTHIVSSMVVYE